MDKLNVFEGKPDYLLGTENRLTWALMGLLRLSPIVCAAFLDLVREKQKRPILGFTTLRERECVVHTQVGTLPANEGRLVAIGITKEGRAVDAEIYPEERDAIYDGLVTIIAPEHRRHELESLILTIESKLGPEVEAWQLNPSEESLGEEHQIDVDPQAVILKWRDILSTLTDLELRELLSPTEKILIRDFLDYVDNHHPQLNPFDHFAVCRDDLNLLKRRCEAILREIDPSEAWHGSSQIIKVDDAQAFKQIWLEVDKNEHQGLWHITLKLWPGDTMAQAREFWNMVNTNMLFALEEKGWKLKPNLHFSYRQTHLVWATTTLSVNDYIEFWRSHRQERIVSFYPDARSFLHHWERLIENGQISPADVEPLERKSTQTKRDRISMSPGLGVCYTWPAKKAVELDRSRIFTDEVKKKIREATETWGEVPGFCGEGDIVG